MTVTNFTHHPDYDNLPGCIKHTITAQEYAWLPDEERARLVERECYPDLVEDD